MDESQSQHPNQAGENQINIENLLPKSNYSQRRQDVGPVVGIVEKNSNLLKSEKQNLRSLTMESIWDKLDL